MSGATTRKFQHRINDCRPRAGLVASVPRRSTLIDVSVMIDERGGFIH